MSIMRTSILLSICLVCFSSSLFCQNNSAKKEKDFRFHVGTSLMFSMTGTKMNNHLTNSGFKGKFNGAFDAIFSGGNDYYPQKDIMPFSLEIGAERRLGKNGWVGLSFGSDKMETAKGYDRYGTGSFITTGTFSTGQFITIEHFSFYLSPTYKMELDWCNYNPFVGAVVTFNTMSTNWGGFGTTYDDKTNLGGVVGISGKIKGNWQWHLTYRHSGNVIFKETEVYDDAGEVRSHFSELELNTSHVRLGAFYQFEIGKKNK